MKKIIISLVILFLFTSCGEEKNIKTDIDKVTETKLDVIKPKKEEKIIINTNKRLKIDYSSEEGKKIISNYYNLISKGNFEEAYNLKFEPKISLEQFIQNYNKNGKAFIIASSIKKELGNKFIFNVGIYYKNVFSEEHFIVTQEIINGKLKLINTKKISKTIKNNKNIVNFGNKKAYIEFDNGEKKLILEDNGIKKIIYTIGYKYGTKGDFDYLDDYIVSNIGEIKFIGNGSILKFSTSAWESGNDLFYIIDNGNIIKSNGILSLYGLTNDKKYFYMCGIDGMGGSNKFNIYDATNGKIVKKLLNGENELGNCSEYNKESNFLVLNKYLKSGEYKKYKYYFDTNILTEEKIGKKVYIESSNLEQKVILEDDKNKTTIYSSKKNKLIKDIENLFFLTDNIIYFTQNMWEGQISYLYNIINGKTISNEKGDYEGITNNNKFIYSCKSSDISKGYLKIYDLNLNLLENIESKNNKYINKCYNYNKEENSINYEIGNIKYKYIFK